MGPSHRSPRAKGLPSLVMIPVHGQKGYELTHNSNLEPIIGNSRPPALDQKQPTHGFKHEGFWRPMDTLKDKEVFENLVEQ
jgi:NDP-sugar pyrophosphorylase family protein